MPDAVDAACPTPGEQTDLLSLLERFDRAWQGQTPPRIDEFLPPKSSATDAGEETLRRQRLEELIKIDLEYRWRHAGRNPVDRSTPRSAGGKPEQKTDTLPARPLLEDYRSRYPELGPIGRFSPDLIGEEYRVRQRWGDRPGHAEYLSRFPIQAPRLRTTLAAIDDELASACTACGTIVAPSGPATEHGQAPRPPFPRVGRYEIGELLGMGGFGSVWHSHDPDLGREVAIKLPRGGSLGSPDQEERFLREARSAAQLRHPGIVAVHDTGRHQGTVYIVSELVHGQSLMHWLVPGRIDFREIAELAAQVADALEYAHGKGVVHRDLKPSNIMLEGSRSDGGPVDTVDPPARGISAYRPRILDFGLAKRDAGEATMTLDGQLLGTLAYMSPEQLRTPHGVNGRGDIYSLGVVLYQLLTHELPFRGSAQMLQIQILEDEPSPPRRLNDRIPRDLETIALKCLAKEPSRRYTSARELADDLRRFQAGEPILARPTGPVERIRGYCRRKPTVAALAVGLALTLVAGFAAVAWQWLRAEGNLRVAKWERDRAETNLVLARRFLNEVSSHLYEVRQATGRLPDSHRKIAEMILRITVTTVLPQSSDPSGAPRGGGGQRTSGLHASGTRPTDGGIDRLSASSGGDRPPCQRASRGTRVRASTDRRPPPDGPLLHGTRSVGSGRGGSAGGRDSLRTARRHPTR